MKKLTMALLLAFVISASAVSAMYPTHYSSKIYVNNNQYMVQVNPGRSIEVSQTYYPEIMNEQKVNIYANNKADLSYYYYPYMYTSPNYGAAVKTVYNTGTSNSKLNVYY